MKKILIVGDSNGLGEWGTVTPGPSVANGSPIFRPFNQDKYLELKHPKPFQLVWPGFGYYLETLFGHAVANHCFGGAGNFEAIFKSEEALGLAPPFTSSVFYNPDIIIWVLTEPLRNYTRIVKERAYASKAGLCDLEKHFEASYEEGIDTVDTIAGLNRIMLKVAFDGAQRVYDETKIPWLLIEGWSGTLGLEKDYTFIKHIHRDWLTKIIGKELPLITSWESINNVSALRSDLAETEEFKNHVNAYEELLDYMKQSADFPDHGHPSRELHEQLAKELEPYV